MSAIPTSLMTVEQYVNNERTADFKSEFYRGEIFAMAGGTVQHATIGGNIFAALRSKLRGTGCSARNSDQRIKVASNSLGTYPDASVVCGKYQTHPEDVDAITNPRVIFEVLSKSTESYDRGKKFDLFRGLESLREYVLVSQEEPQVERYVRHEDETWTLTIFKGTDAVVRFESIDAELTLAEIYEDVEFE